MHRSSTILKTAVFLLILAFTFSPAAAQKKPKKDMPPQGKAIMWEPVNIKRRDLLLGPGGNAMRPDLSQITFIKEETSGHNKKYRIKDGAGRVWVAKLGREAQPETAAVRLLWSLGYKTEINYLVPDITIPGKGTFKNVRLEARPDNIERLNEWKWKNNPFVGTNELQGLKMMMVFFNNWDVLDLQNQVLATNGKNGKELHYIVSDLGSTFGRLGNNNLPIIYRLGRSTGKPQHYIKSKFVKGAKDGEIKLAYKGKNRGLFKGFTREQGRWLADLLLQLSDKQIEDAFLAANYKQEDLQTFTRAVKNKIGELDRATLQQRLAQKQPEK